MSVLITRSRLRNQYIFLNRGLNKITNQTFIVFIDPAKVTFTPTVQYLPFRLAGVVQCYIKANPPLQYVTWTKDKRLLEPYQQKDIVIMNNGSLLFTRVLDFDKFLLK